MLKKFIIAMLIVSFSVTVIAEDSKPNKKVIFLADKGKNSLLHAHISGNALLAEALEKSGLGIQTSQHVGWPKDPDAFKDASCIVIFCNGGKTTLAFK